MSTPPPPPPPFGSDQPAPGQPQYGQAPPPPPPYGQPQQHAQPPQYAPPPPQYGSPGVPPGYQAYQPGYGGQPQMAGFGSRLGAFLIDGLIGGLFAIPAVVSVFLVPTEYQFCDVDGDPGICEVPTAAGWAVIIGLGVLFGLAYLVIYCRMVGRGQSWGMKAVGNKIVSADSGQPIGTGRSVGRYFARILSGIPCYLGYLWMLWDSKKQTWHDKIVGSYHVKA